MEWKPSFVKGQPPRPAALIQLAFFCQVCCWVVGRLSNKLRARVRLQLLFLCRWHVCMYVCKPPSDLWYSANCHTWNQSLVDGRGCMWCVHVRWCDAHTQGGQDRRVKVCDKGQGVVVLLLQIIHSGITPKLQVS